MATQLQTFGAIVGIIYVRTIVQTSTKSYKNPYKCKYLTDLFYFFWIFQFFVVPLSGFCERIRHKLYITVANGNQN